MRIAYSSVMVSDQEQALRFYTEMLGFVKKEDISVGEFRFLTVVSPEPEGGAELLLEPNAHPAAQTFQAAIKADGIPATMFVVDDVQQEHDRLVGLGVKFTTPPTVTEMATYAILDDTCGNLIQIVAELT